MAKAAEACCRHVEQPREEDAGSGQTQPPRRKRQPRGGVSRLKQEFETAAAEVQKLPSRPDNDTLLKLYSLYKQATEGDAKGSRPGLLDLKGRKKYDAWAAIRGMD